jgi:hypothetical protein
MQHAALTIGVPLQDSIRFARMVEERELMENDEDLLAVAGLDCFVCAEIESLPLATSKTLPLLHGGRTAVAIFGLISKPFKCLLIVVKKLCVLPLVFEVELFNFVQYSGTTRIFAWPVEDVLVEQVISLACELQEWFLFHNACSTFDLDFSFHVSALRYVALQFPVHAFGFESVAVGP